MITPDLGQYRTVFGRNPVLENIMTVRFCFKYNRKPHVLSLLQEVILGVFYECLHNHKTRVFQLPNGPLDAERLKEILAQQL